MEKLSSKNQRKYLSVPALNKISNEVYQEGNRFLSDNNSDPFHSMNYGSNRSVKNERRKSFLSIFSLNGSSTNEKTKFGSLKPLDLHIPPRTRNSSSLLAGYAKTDSAYYSSSCKHVSPSINRIIPSMTQAHSVSRGPTDPDGSAGAPLITKNFETSELIQSSRSSKARQKKFHRHFKQVDDEEKVLNYYSCALVGDILLQGHLYITENFFAFYSNVFGYVTKGSKEAVSEAEANLILLHFELHRSFSDSVIPLQLLIPTADVLKISKEKTAKIIPNAVGISTEDEKHVFGSLLSRDATYKFMLRVWKEANSTNLASNPPPVIKPEMPTDEDSSVSTGNEDPSSYISNLTNPASSDNLQSLLPKVKRKSVLMTSMEVQSSKFRWYSFRVKTLLVVSVALLVFLLGSAGFLLYRIALIQNSFSDLSISTRGSEVYEDIVQWQSTLHSKSANKISEFINANLNQIVKVRLSLEALSMLILPKNTDAENSNSKWESTNVEKKLEKTNSDGS